MKSQAMKTAWLLFRKYQITFSQALIEGWKRVKRELLKLEFAKTTSDEVTYRTKLVKRYNEIKINLFLPRDYDKSVVVVDLKLDGRYESWMN
jgi:hypothetical protein